MAKLLYQGHASVRITTDEGVVVYIDPYAGDGYGAPADLILVTHQHHDHNQLGLPARKADCTVIQNADALQNGQYKAFTVKGVKVAAVPASNKNHPRGECVGYVLEFDGIKLYHAGDTSKIPEMTELKSLSLDYALLPTDGIYNMSAAEASECAAMIGAKTVIPFHTNPKVLFDDEIVRDFSPAGRKIVHPGEEITL